MKLSPLMRVTATPPGAWLATLATVGVLCAIVAYWSMQLAAPRAPLAPSASSSAGREPPDLSTASTLFGIPQQAPAVRVPVLGNVQVLGVVSAGSRGSAILIVDGKPARSFAVGDAIGPGQRIRTVRGDAVVIDDNGRTAEVTAPTRANLAVLISGAGRARGSTDPALQAPLGSPQPGALQMLPQPSPSANQPPGGAMPTPGNPGFGAGPGPTGADISGLPTPAPIPTMPQSAPGQSSPPAHNLVKPPGPSS